MIIQSEAVNVTRSGGATESTFQIKASRKAFDVLSSALYSDKIKAVVRELCVNGYDSHVANGNPDTPIEIHLPTQIDPQFYVRDFGTGLSKEDIMGRYETVTDDNGNTTEVFIPGLYQTFFDSNKTDSNDFVGMLGLGSKSPLSYSSQFMVESRHGGMKRSYCVFKNEDGLPVVRLMNEEPLGDEPTGMTITLAVRPSDVDKFYSAARKALMYFTPIPNVVGQSGWTPYALKHTVSGDGWKLRESEYYAYMSGPYVVQGFIAYPIDHALLTEHKKLSDEASALCTIDLDLYVNIGDVDIAPSREALSYDRRTIDNLACNIEQAAAAMRTSFQNAFDDCANRWEAQMLLDRYMYGQKSKFKDVFRKMHKTIPFTFDGKALKDETTVMLSGTGMMMVSVCMTATKKKVRMMDAAYANGIDPTYTATANMATHVIVDTAAKGNNEPLLQFLRACPSVDGHERKVILIRPIDANAFSQHSVDNIIEQLGHPPYQMVSDLPYVPTKRAARVKSGAKRDKSVMLVWAGFPSTPGLGRRSDPVVRRVYSRLTWTPTAIDLEEGGLYIPIERFTAMQTYNGAVFTELDKFIKDAKLLGLLDDDVVIVGMNEKELARAQKVGEWVNVVDEVIADFEMENEHGELTNVMVQSRMTDVINERLPNFTTNIIENWDSLVYKITDGPFKSFCQSVVDFNTTVADVPLAVVTELTNLVHIKTDTHTMPEDFRREVVGMFQKYDLFKIFDWTNMVPAKFPMLIEYINSVDLERNAS